MEQQLEDSIFTTTATDSYGRTLVPIFSVSDETGDIETVWEVPTDKP